MHDAVLLLISCTQTMLVAAANVFDELCPSSTASDPATERRRAEYKAAVFVTVSV